MIRAQRRQRNRKRGLGYTRQLSSKRAQRKYGTKSFSQAKAVQRAMRIRQHLQDMLVNTMATLKEVLDPTVHGPHVDTLRELESAGKNRKGVIAMLNKLERQWHKTKS